MERKERVWKKRSSFVVAHLVFNLLCEQQRERNKTRPSEEQKKQELKKKAWCMTRSRKVDSRGDMAAQE